MRLLLVRHGHTPDNDSLIYTGQRDTPLSSLGECEAHALSIRLTGEPLAAVYCSDLARATGTAERVAQPHDLAVQRRSGLRELAMGKWEGRTYAQLALEDAAQLAQWIADPEHSAPPDGETAAEVRSRVRSLLLDQYQEYSEHTIAWITHGGVIGVLICDVLGLPVAQRWRLRCDLASITTVDVWIPSGNSQRWVEGTLACLNDTSHVQQLQLPCLAADLSGPHGGPASDLS
jgi:broad specificity phosphatase PhoE